MDSHGLRVRLIKAAGGVEVSAGGLRFWGVFRDDFEPMETEGRVVHSRPTIIEASVDDAGGLERGAQVEIGTNRYQLENSHPFDSGMVRLFLMAMQ